VVIAAGSVVGKGVVGAVVGGVEVMGVAEGSCVVGAVVGGVEVMGVAEGSCVVGAVVGGVELMGVAEGSGVGIVGFFVFTWLSSVGEFALDGTGGLLIE
jgi:hypothetical protein